MHGTLVGAPEGPRNVRALERIRAADDGKCARRIGLLADPQTDYSGLRKAARALEREEGVDFHVVLGDVADNGFAWEFDRMNASLDELSRPVVVVAGNHDLMGNGRKIFAEAYGPKDFVLDLPPYRFISWDNNRLEHGGRSRMPELRRLLAVPPVAGLRTTIVLSHVPRAQASEHVWPAAERAEYCRYLKDTPIALAVHGHIHAWGFVRSACGSELVVGRVDEAGHYGTLDLRCDGSWESRRCVAGKGCANGWSSEDAKAPLPGATPPG